MSVTRSPQGVSTPSYVIPPSMRNSRGMINDYFRGIGTTGLSQPQGILGSVYQNLFGADNTQDFLGARGALQRSLSGEGLGQNIQTAYNQLLPTALRNISEGSNALATAAGPAGLRFSTDLMGQQSRLGSDILGQTQGQALNAGLQEQQLQGGLASSLYGNVLQGALSQMPINQILGYGTSFPSPAESSETGKFGGANFMGRLFGALTGGGNTATSAGIS